MDQLKSQIDEARKELRELKSGSLQKGEHLSGKKIWTSKDIQVMIYELAVYRTLFGKVNELCDSELMCNSSACLSRLHQTSELSAKVACLQANCSQVERQLQKATQQSQQLSKLNAILRDQQTLLIKKCQVYQRKSEECDRHGGKEAYNKARQDIEDLKEQLRKTKEQNKLMSIKHQQLGNRITILTDLNQNTEQELAQYLISKLDTRKKSFSNHIAKQNNDCNIVLKQYPETSASNNRNRVSELANKQEKRQLRQRIAQLEDKNLKMKGTLAQRECFYGKLIQNIQGEAQADIQTQLPFAPPPLL